MVGSAAGLEEGLAADWAVGSAAGSAVGSEVVMPGVRRVEDAAEEGSGAGLVVMGLVAGSAGHSEVGWVVSSAVDSMVVGSEAG